MANPRPMYEVIGRAILDRLFREALLRNPATATRAAGYSLSEAQIKSLERLTFNDLQRATDCLLHYANPDRYASGDPHVNE